MSSKKHNSSVSQSQVSLISTQQESKRAGGMKVSYSEYGSGVKATEKIAKMSCYGCRKIPLYPKDCKCCN